MQNQQCDFVRLRVGHKRAHKPGCNHAHREVKKRKKNKNRRIVYEQSSDNWNKQQQQKCRISSATLFGFALGTRQLKHLGCDQAQREAIMKTKQKTQKNSCLTNIRKGTFSVKLQRPFSREARLGDGNQQCKISMSSFWVHKARSRGPPDF